MCKPRGRSLAEYAEAQRPLRLVAFDRDSTRWVDPDYAPKETPTMLADGFPVLLTSMESHRALDRWVGEPSRYWKYAS